MYMIYMLFFWRQKIFSWSRFKNSPEITFSVGASEDNEALRELCFRTLLKGFSFTKNIFLRSFEKFTRDYFFCWCFWRKRLAFFRELCFRLLKGFSFTKKHFLEVLSRIRHRIILFLLVILKVMFNYDMYICICNDMRLRYVLISYKIV